MRLPHWLPMSNNLLLTSMTSIYLVVEYTYLRQWIFAKFNNISDFCVPVLPCVGEFQLLQSNWSEAESSLQLAVNIMESQISNNHPSIVLREL